MAEQLKLGDLPRELDSFDAIEAVHGTDLDWALDKLTRGSSVLIECDKQISQFLYIGLRNRLRSSSRPVTCRLIDGRRIEGPGTVVQKMVQDLEEAVKEATEGTIVVLPHLDLLTTTTRSGLTAEARETILWFYENPEVTFLCFQDSSFELPQVLLDLFPARRSLLGCPRDRLGQVVLQREARKFAVDTFRPFQLFKYVSGLNVLRLRKVLEQFHDARDFHPDHPETAQEILREIRKMTVQGGMDLPSVDLEQDIGGYASVKDRIRKDLLELYGRRDSIGDEAQIQVIEELLPKGIIFSGPPGTGKTFFAKAIATALDATLQVVNGPELKSKWVGESEANLRRVFQKARESAPSIIVFDELDSFATRRGTYASSGVEHSMVNQLLTEMDGFHKDELVLVIGTTNFVESLDPALVRPGRFELSVEVPFPKEEDRRSILEIYRKKFDLDLGDEVLESMVRSTEGFVDREHKSRFTGDHLYAICRALKRNELRLGRHPIQEKEVLESIRNESSEDVGLNEDEERIVASHEAGHALLAYLLPHASNPETIAITADQPEALGYVIQKVKKNRYVTHQAELLDSICVSMGGRIGEELLIGEVGVGAAHDLIQATEVARMMVERLGMSEAGPVVYVESNSRGRVDRRELSESTSQKLDQEVERILRTQMTRARDLLTTRQSTLEAIVSVLLEKKKLDGDQFEQLIQEATRGEDHPTA